jgi:regulatory protein
MAGTITALVAQKKNTDRVNVYLDGKFAFGLAAIEAVKLKRGQMLSDEDIARLHDVDAAEKAHERALHFLSFRPRSEAEVRRNLKDGKFAPDVIESAIARLKQAGLVDDRAFGAYWLENRGQFSPRSARALKLELRQKGIDAETIDAALSAAAHDEDEAAFQAALPRARRLAKLEAREFKQKLGAYLGRRGFSYDIIQDAVKRAWETVQSESPDSSFDFDNEED